MGCSGVLASGPSSDASQLSPRQPRHLPSSQRHSHPASVIQKGAILEALPSPSASVKSASQGPVRTVPGTSPESIHLTCNLITIQVSFVSNCTAPSCHPLY